MPGDVAQSSRIEELENSVRAGNAQCEELIELALRYLWALHRSEEGISLLDRAAQMADTCHAARLWLGYFRIHEMPSEAEIKAGIDILRELLQDSPDLIGAASLVLASGLLSLREHDEAEIVSELEKSVAAEPDWVLNRIMLARRYLKLRRPHDAERCLSSARRAFLSPGWRGDFVATAFETLITGRLSDAARRTAGELETEIRAIG